jgi:hypothetical protein
LCEYKPAENIIKMQSDSIDVCGVLRHCFLYISPVIPPDDPKTTLSVARAGWYILKCAVLEAWLKRRK